MSKDIVASRDNNVLLIVLGDSFDYVQGRKFQSECEKHSGIDQYILDFRHVDQIDSSALGRLLLLRSRSGNERSNIVLRNVNKPIADVFRISQFYKLFKIE